ncbi:MAG TPA: LytTR family DNA-binding domain-containing protein [Casimicrobiaceae bacterium]|nr:LytTR family DNA-binding domain-containing protein [Casimicrobiaceae bacterium]
MIPPTAVIAEDEAKLRDALRTALASLWPELVVKAEARNGLEATEAVDRYRPDILFLDIEMPGMTGLDVAKRVNGRCHIVFVTAYDDYAVSAFEHEAVDYVMKPFSTERLGETVRRLKLREGARPVDLERFLAELAQRRQPVRDYLRWITVPHGEESRFVTLDEVCYFQSDNKYTRVVTAESTSLIRRTIKELAEEIDPKAFWQIHRSTLVNVNSISGIMRDFAGHTRVRLKQRKETLPVSEPYLHLFRNL